MLSHYTISTHPINPPCQPILLTHLLNSPSNSPCQATLLTHPINPPYQPTLSTHPINSPCQATLLTHLVNPPHQLTLSSHPINPPCPPTCQLTLSTHPYHEIDPLEKFNHAVMTVAEKVRGTCVFIRIPATEHTLIQFFGIPPDRLPQVCYSSINRNTQLHKPNIQFLFLLVSLSFTILLAYLIVCLIAILLAFSRQIMAVDYK